MEKKTWKAMNVTIGGQSEIGHEKEIPRTVNDFREWNGTTG